MSDQHTSTTQGHSRSQSRETAVNHSRQSSVSASYDSVSASQQMFTAAKKLYAPYPDVNISSSVGISPSSSPQPPDIPDLSSSPKRVKTFTQQGTQGSTNGHSQNIEGENTGEDSTFNANDSIAAALERAKEVYHDQEPHFGGQPTKRGLDRDDDDVYDQQKHAKSGPSQNEIDVYNGQVLVRSAVDRQYQKFDSYGTVDSVNNNRYNGEPSSQEEEIIMRIHNNQLGRNNQQQQQSQFSKYKPGYNSGYPYPPPATYQASSQAFPPNPDENVHYPSYQFEQPDQLPDPSFQQSQYSSQTPYFGGYYYSQQHAYQPQRQGQRPYSSAYMAHSHMHDQSQWYNNRLKYDAYGGSWRSSGKLKDAPPDIDAVHPARGASNHGYNDPGIGVFDHRRVVVDEDEEGYVDEDNRVLAPENESGTFEEFKLYSSDNEVGFPPLARTTKEPEFDHNAGNNYPSDLVHSSNSNARADDGLNIAALYKSIGLQTPADYQGAAPFAKIHKVVIDYLNNPKYRTFRLFAQQPLVAQKSYGEERRFFLPPQLRLYGFTRTVQASIRFCGQDFPGVVDKGFVSWKRMCIPSHVEEKEVSLFYTVVNGNITYTLPAPSISKLSKPSKKKLTQSIPSGDLVSFYLRTKNRQHYLVADGPTSTDYWDSFIVDGELRYGETVTLRNRKGTRVVNLNPVVNSRSFGDVIAPLGKLVLNGVDRPIESTYDDIEGIASSSRALSNMNRVHATPLAAGGIWTVVPVIATSLTFHVPSPARQEFILPRITRMETADEYLVIYGTYLPSDVWVFVSGEPANTVKVFADCIQCWSPTAYIGKIHLASESLLIDCGVIND